MPEIRPCPHCGAPITIESTTHVTEGADPIGTETSRPVEAGENLDLTPVALLAPGSHDDVFGSSSSSRITAAEPDPILGGFVTPSSSPSASTILQAPPGTRSGEAFPTIDLGSKIKSVSSHRTSPEDLESRDDEEFEPEGRRTSWITVLLASYASAITLGLVWLVMKDRPKAKPVIAQDRPTAVASVSPKQAGLSRKVEPPEPILGEHFATMGKPLRVGDLEITPVDVKRQGIQLRRSAQFAKADRKDGGKGALVLRLKLKNISKDSVFSPLDQSYLRERGKQILDTFIETDTAERIYPYPLAIESEWSIVGQDFEELRPGESRVVSIFSAPDAPPDSSGPFTWRVRLRTGINRTDTIGLIWPVR